VEIIIYITVNLLLFSSWYTLLFRSKERLSFVDRLLGVFVLGLTQIVVTEMVLGVVFKKLYATPLLILNISISLAVLAIAVIKRKQDRGRGGLFADIFQEIKDAIVQFINLIRKDWILLSVFMMFFIYFCYFQNLLGLLSEI